MTEFKERLIFETTDKLQNNIFELIRIQGCLYPQELIRIITSTLREELNDVVVIDRNKLKEKMDVVYRGYSGDNMYNPYSHFETRLNFVQYFTPETVMSVDIDILKDRMKDDVIAKLEECDF